MRKAAFWTLPSLLSLLLYWPGLTAWFQKDDFAWLGLRRLLDRNEHDLWWVLFAPLAQGTVRTLSERVFFLSFYSLFELHALPYRLLVFATEAATLALLCLVCMRLTRSRAAGFWAAVLWTVNSTVAFVMSWTAIYYELLCSFVFLLAFLLLLKYIETGERRFYVGQWIVFLLGFGVLELNVVYPALALAYGLCCARGAIRQILPLFIPSAIYTVLHTLAAPFAASGPYKMYWNLSVFSTFWTYWKIALGPNRLIYLGIYPSALRSLLTIALMAGIFGFLAWKLWRRQWLAAFFAAWFVIVLAPLLPLRDHISDYYLTVPLLGPAMLAGWAAVSGWRAGMFARTASVALVAAYLCVAIPVARVNAVSFADRSHRIETVLRSIVQANQKTPGRTIVLKGLDFDMFWSAIVHRPLRLYGIDDVYVLGSNQPAIAPRPQPPDIQQFFINDADAQAALLLDLSEFK